MTKGIVIFEIIEDVTKLVVSAAIIQFLFKNYIRLKKPRLAASIERNRLFILLGLGAALVAVKVSEDALTGESGPVDKSILLFLHRHVPTAFTPFFEAVTETGSFRFLASVLIINLVAFTLSKRWFELRLLLSSAICGALMIYLLKTVTGRERPALWETQWYWGTSFPSGHTLETACFATALAFCLSRIWPAQQKLLWITAFLWTTLVACSRLVLGVHWPTDVLAAACLGMLIAITIQFVLEHSTNSTHRRI